MNGEKRTCIFYDDVEISWGHAPLCCSVLSGNESLALEQWIPYRICPALLHTAYPYFLTFSRGGRFAWLKEKNSVIFQCPRPGDGRIAQVSKEKKKIILKILDDGRCPRKDDAQEIILSSIDGRFCFRAFDAIFPYVNHVAAHQRDGSGGPLSVACSGCRNERTRFTIHTTGALNG